MIRNNPRIVTNGLMFYYDMSNTKSYRSPPIRNVLNQITPRSLGTVGAAYIFTSGTENVYIPTLGWVDNCKYVDMFNDSSQGCCPSPFSYGEGLTVSGSTEYTYAIVYKSVNGYTHPNYMYHFEYTSGGSYLTDYGVFYSGPYSGQIRHLGDNWYWASAKFTTNASAGYITTGSWMYEYNRFNRLYVAKAMIVQGDYTNLHPRFWPALGTTVSNTQSLYDLTGTNTITANSLTYASDGTFEFQPANHSSTLTIPLSTSFNKLTGTINMWVYPRGYSISNGLFVNRDNTTYNALDWFWIGSWTSGSTFYFRLGDGTDCCSQDLSVSNWISVCPINQWTNVCVTWQSGSASTIYVNDNQIATRSITTIPSTNPSTTGRIGLGHGSSNDTGSWNGMISSTSIYNRAPTADEVAQNFNAIRGRYGL